MQKSSSVLVKKQNYTILPRILKQQGYEDLRNCKYYFAGSFYNSTGPGNYETSDDKCQDINFKVAWYVSLVQFESDFHIQTVLNILRAGKLFCKIISVLKELNYTRKRFISLFYSRDPSIWNRKKRNYITRCKTE